jgi:hypothetical protein
MDSAGKSAAEAADSARVSTMSCGNGDFSLVVALSWSLLGIRQWTVERE